MVNLLYLTQRNCDKIQKDTYQPLYINLSHHIVLYGKGKYSYTYSLENLPDLNTWAILQITETPNQGDPFNSSMKKDINNRKPQRRLPVIRVLF